MALFDTRGFGFVVVLTFGACAHEGDGAPGDAATDTSAPDATGVATTDASAGDADSAAPSDTAVATDATTTDASEGDGETTVATSQVVLNEVRCKGAEFVELTNGGATPAPLVGWIVGEDRTDPLRHYVFPEGTPALAPGAFVTVAADLGDLPSGIRSGLSCGADVVRLWAPDGTPVDDVATVGNLLPDATWGRVPDASGAWGPNEATPGAANRALALDPRPLFAPTAVFEVDLGLDETSIAALDADPYTWVPGTITLRRPTGEVFGPHAVGVRLKGKYGSFRPLGDKSGFKVKLDFVDDALHLEGLRKLTFNNMVQDSSMLHEAIAYTIFRAAGVAAPSVGYAWIRLNGEAYGLYAHIETADDYLVHRRDPVWFPTTQHIYEGEYGLDVRPGEVDTFDIDAGPDDRADLVALAAALEAAPRGPGFMAALAPHVDFEQMTRAWAVEHWIGHWDGYTGPIVNNYYLHSDAAGVFRMIPWGTDQTFADHLPMDQAYGELFVRCLPDPACRALYTRAIIDTTAAVRALDLAGLVDAIAAATAPWIADDPKRPYDLDTIAWSVEGTKDFIASRPDDFPEWLACADTPDVDGDGDRVVCLADCDDGDAAVHPGAADTCDDGLDQDCSGRADDGLGCSDGLVVTRGAHRYLVSDGQRTWDDARLHCQAWGGDLAVPDSAEEAAWLAWQAPVLGTRDTWIGLTDRAAEGTWRDVAGEVPRWLGWDGGQPDDYDDEDCASLWSYAEGRWNDATCEARLWTLCEAPCTPDGDGDGFATCEGDGDDGDDRVHPGAEDTCGDLVDQDGNGRIDDGAGCPPSCDAIELGGRLYRFCGDAQPWDEARTTCRELGLDLVTTRASDESDAVLAASGRFPAFVDGYWIGLSDRDREGVWDWSTGAVLTEAEALWDGGQPDDWNASEDCVAMWPWGRWNDYGCEDTWLPFVCEAACSAPDAFGCP